MWSGFSSPVHGLVESQTGTALRIARLSAGTIFSSVITCESLAGILETLSILRLRETGANRCVFASDSTWRNVTFSNCYEDLSRAGAYATLEFANTYYLAYRDLPAIIANHVTGAKALISAVAPGGQRGFLRKLSFGVSGVDISEDMLAMARRGSVG